MLFFRSCDSRALFRLNRYWGNLLLDFTIFMGNPQVVFLIALIAFTACQGNRFSLRPNAIDWTNAKAIFDIVKNVAELIAIGMAGAWAYFNFFKGRTYKTRLEPKISGKLISKNGSDYRVFTAQLKNIGLSDVEIAQKGSAIRVFKYGVEASSPQVSSVGQTRLATLPVFESHKWIESGETIEDRLLIAIPEIDYVALQLQLRLVSNRTEWNSAAIVEHLPIEGDKGLQRLPGKENQFRASAASSGELERQKEVVLEKSVVVLPRQLCGKGRSMLRVGWKK